MNGDRLAIWQTRPCPPWCATKHGDHDLPDGRYCCGGEVGRAEQTLRREPAETVKGGAHLDYLWAEINFGPHDAEPYLYASRGDSSDAAYEMALDEAEAWARSLLALVDRAKRDGAA